MQVRLGRGRYIRNFLNYQLPRKIFFNKILNLPNLLSRSPNILYELDAAALALLHWRHVLDVPGVVEGVPAPLVPAAVAGEAVDVVPGCGKSQ